MVSWFLIAVSGSFYIRWFDFGSHLGTLILQEITMSQIEFQGPLHHRVASFLTLGRVMLKVAARHATGRRIAQDWDMLTEVGIRFVRHQFTYAMRCKDIEQGRARFNSLLTKTADTYDVTIEETGDPAAFWFTPQNLRTDAVAFYCHGGGYAFRGPVTYRYAKMLAHHLGARVYMPLYRLTPEHPHPAQADDALAAWREVTTHCSADQIVLIGDSAGGHMALMLLQQLESSNLQQPALCICLCPWTDIGARGDSMTLNNHYDLVQGWMALEFARWLDPDCQTGQQVLSPIQYDYSGLSPLYIQAGGREVLRDMIVHFSEKQVDLGAQIQLDVWEDMPHNFQAYDSTKRSSRAALARIAEVFHNGIAQRGAEQRLFPAPLKGVTRVSQD